MSNHHHVVMESIDDPENPGKKIKRPVLIGTPRPGTVRARTRAAMPPEVIAEKEAMAKQRAELEQRQKDLEKRERALQRMEARAALGGTPDDDDDDETDDGTDDDEKNES